MLKVKHSAVCHVHFGLSFFVILHFVCVSMCVDGNSVFLHINPTAGSKVHKVRGKKARSGPHEAVLSQVKDMSVHEIDSQC